MLENVSGAEEELEKVCISPQGYKKKFHAQLSTKFQLLIKIKIQKSEDVSCFKSLECCIYHANKC